MSNLLVWKEKLQRLYAKYSFYIDKAIQFALAFLTFSVCQYEAWLYEAACTASHYGGVGSCMCIFANGIYRTCSSRFNDCPSVFAFNWDCSHSFGSICPHVYFLFSICTKNRRDYFACSNCICIQNPICNSDCMGLDRYTDSGTSDCTWCDNVLHDYLCE